MWRRSRSGGYFGRASTLLFSWRKGSLLAMLPWFEEMIVCSEVD